MEGYDRLANLGVAEVRVTVRLTAIRPPWYRRLWNRVTRAADKPAYRLHTRGDGPPALTFRATVGRDAHGRWMALLDRDRRAERAAASDDATTAGDARDIVTPTSM
jgi:hypothetical protein